MKSPDELIAAHPDAYFDGVRFVQSWLDHLAQLDRGNPAPAEADPRCNGSTIGCPS